ncbi:MAG: M20 family metallopeptidase, partial [Candidatus Binataceae bacterium]
AFNTVSANSDLDAVQYLAAELRHHGFSVAEQPIELSGTPHANLVAWAGPPRDGGLIISAHIDTVPFAGQPGWTREPLKLELAGERIYGRGTSDMKCFIAQCLDAARQLDKTKLTRPLVFVFTAGEEVGCLGAKEAAAGLARILDGTPAPQIAWIGEPTSYELCHAHKSIVLFDVTVRGRGGHSGAPAEGVNAIAVMGKVIDAVGRYQAELAASPSPAFARVFPESPFDVLNFGTIHGGLALNMIAEECRLAISYRSLPEEDPLAVFREIERRLAMIDAHDYASRNHLAAIALTAPMVVPPLNAPRGTDLERVLCDVTGASDSRGALFGTDGGWFSRSGIVSLICGPGDLDQAHQPDESIRREPFERGTAIVLKVIDRMCCREAPRT